MTSFQETCEHAKTNHQKHVHGNLQLCLENQQNINNLMPPQGPPGPFQTLGLAILQRVYDIFQKSAKKPKKNHHKTMLVQLCL